MVRAACNDLDVAWFEWGRGDPLLLVHGLADDHRAWRKVLPWLAADRRVIACDVRGHGQTSLGNPDGTLAQLGGDLVALMDVLDLERAERYPASEALERLVSWSAPARQAHGIEVVLPPLNGAQRQRRMLDAGASLPEVYGAMVTETRETYAGALGTTVEVTR